MVHHDHLGNNTIEFNRVLISLLINVRRVFDLQPADLERLVMAVDIDGGLTYIETA